MQCGCPVVTSNNSSLPEVVGDAALTVDARDETGLALAIERICNDDTLRAALCEKGVRRAERFTWRRCAEATVAAYERALAAQRRRQRLGPLLRLRADVAGPPQLVGARSLVDALADPGPAAEADPGSGRRHRLPQHLPLLLLFQRRFCRHQRRCAPARTRQQRPLPRPGRLPARRRLRPARVSRRRVRCGVLSGLFRALRRRERRALGGRTT